MAIRRDFVADFSDQVSEAWNRYATSLRIVGRFALAAPLPSRSVRSLKLEAEPGARGAARSKSSTVPRPGFRRGGSPAGSGRMTARARRRGNRGLPARPADAGRPGRRRRRADRRSPAGTTDPHLARRAHVGAYAATLPPARRRIPGSYRLPVGYVQPGHAPGRVGLALARAAGIAASRPLVSVPLRAARVSTDAARAAA